MPLCDSHLLPYVFCDFLDSQEKHFGMFSEYFYIDYIVLWAKMFYQKNGSKTFCTKQKVFLNNVVFGCF